MGAIHAEIGAVRWRQLGCTRSWWTDDSQLADLSHVVGQQGARLTDSHAAPLLLKQESKMLELARRCKVGDGRRSVELDPRGGLETMPMSNVVDVTVAATAHAWALRVWCVVPLFVPIASPPTRPRVSPVIVCATAGYRIVSQWTIVRQQ